jgi:TonB family protein
MVWACWAIALGGACGHPPVAPEPQAQPPPPASAVDDEGPVAAKKWKFAGYFSGIKRKVSKVWNAGTEYLRKQGVDDRQGRYTLLAVTLTAEGTLRDVAVERSSGLEEVDRVAMLSFRGAQPFGRAPPQLVGPDGLVRFKFGIHLDRPDGQAQFGFGSHLDAGAPPATGAGPADAGR